MAEPTGDNILKVLSGNQFGAEVTLSDGTYSFGSGPEADIQLDDVALQPIHGQVRLRDGKIELRAAQGELNTASGLSVARDDGDWHEIAQMDAVSAGLSKFVIAGPGADWSSLSTSNAPRIGPKPKSHGSPSILSTIPRRAIYAIGGIAAVLGLAAVLGNGGGDAAPSPGSDATATAIAALRTEITGMPFADQVQVTERADGTLAVEGYVEEQVERRAIQNSVDETGLPATLRIYVRENLRADVQGTIDSMALPASFTLDPDGNLTLTGTILDPTAAQKLLENIQTGVFGLASVTSNIRTADNILSELRTIAQDAGLGDLVIFRLDGLVVEATGIVPRDKMDNWVGLIGVYSRRFAQEIPLRSFVTLDQPAGEDVAPIIIGSGPAAEAETGRFVAPETLAEPNEVDAQSLFAGSPAEGAAPAPAATPPVQTPRSNLAQALERLQDERPDLLERITTEVEAGRTPDTALLQEILAVIGGTLDTSTDAADGTPEVKVQVQGIGNLGTLDEIAANLRSLLSERRAEEARTTPGQPFAAVPIAAAPMPRNLVLAATTDEQATSETPPLAAEEQAATATPLPVQAPLAATATPDTTMAETQSDQPAAQPSTQPATQPATQQPTQTAATTLPLFALPQGQALSLQPLLDEVDRVIAREDRTAAGEGVEVVSPNLRALVDMQNEQLAFGKTLMRLPEPLSALPYPVDQAQSCWEGGRLTPELMPTVLLLLDALSVSSTTDISGLTPDLRDVAMETALSPQRVRSCITRTQTAFADMVANSSTFLAETERNPDFVEFLFRNVPKGQLPVAGANLTSDRYIELRSGRKLREGAAPDVTSRITSIGDLGILLRTAEGSLVQLYGNALGWRVADACATPSCEVN